MSPRIFLVGRARKRAQQPAVTSTALASRRRRPALERPAVKASGAPTALARPRRPASGRGVRQKLVTPADRARPTRFATVVTTGRISHRRIAGAGVFAEQERAWYRYDRKRSLAAVRTLPPVAAVTPGKSDQRQAAGAPAHAAQSRDADGAGMSPDREPAVRHGVQARAIEPDPEPTRRARHDDELNCAAVPALTRSAGAPHSGAVSAPRHRSRTSRRRSRPRRPPPRKQRLRLGKVFGWTLLGACILVIAGSAWVGWRTYQAYNHLQAASAGVTTLQDQLTDITAVDPQQTAQTVSRLQAEAADARAAVDDPVFRAAGVLPFVGPNLTAIDQVTVTVDALASNVMPSLVDVATTLQPSTLAPKNGAVDLAPIQRIAPLLQSADESVTGATTELAGIDRSELMRPLADAVDTLSGKLQLAAEVTEPAARAARLMPAMLGSDRPRTYLVVFQNPSELRATGGIFGSYGVLAADNGKLDLVEQGAVSRNLGYFDPPVATLSPNELALYGDLMVRYPQDVNFTPDFPRAAALFAQMYQQRSGKTVDGVLAIDPVALSYTLEGTPGIDVGNGVTLRSDNLVDTLLSTAYAQFDDAGQTERDAFLDSATSTVFARVMAGQAEPTAIIEGLQRAATERRVLIYSAHPTEEADISRTSLAGSLGADPDKPSIGVFLNDGTGAKLGYYLRNQVHLTQVRCRPDGRPEIQLRVTMTFDPPPADAPSYVTGVTEPGEPYVVRTNVLAFAPAGGTVTAAQRDGRAISIKTGQDGGRQVGTATIEMAPGTSTELVFTVLGPPGPADGAAAAPPALVLTPGVNPWRTSVDRFRPCVADAS